MNLMEHSDLSLNVQEIGFFLCKKLLSVQNFRFVVGTPTITTFINHLVHKRIN